MVLRKPDGIPIQAVIVIGLAVLLWFILNRHRFGEALLFIGDNANVARVMGIDVKTTRIKLFTLMGALAGLAGMFLTMETENFTTTQGQGMLLVVIAAVFIGGTSIFGGSGTIVGSYIGLLIVVMLQIGMVAHGPGRRYRRHGDRPGVPRGGHPAYAGGAPGETEGNAAEGTWVRQSITLQQ